jgi:hypothetical protein
MPITARLILALVAAVAVSGCSSLTRSSPIGKDSTMAQDSRTRIAGDGPDLALSSVEIAQAGEALETALNNREMRASSRAPETMLAWLDGSYAAAHVSSAGDVRAGRWLLTSAEQGPLWVMRVATPEPPRRGMLFQVPIVRDVHGFRATGLHFVRLL